jgi:hypothetical protein
MEDERNGGWVFDADFRRFFCGLRLLKHLNYVQQPYRNVRNRIGTQYPPRQCTRLRMELSTK